MRFIHVADIHLGNRQYNNQQRFIDFSMAFKKCVDLAIQESVDAFIISGDLFHKSSIDPDTLLQAENNLSRLTENQIHTLVIAGNHDRPRYGQSTTWLDYLVEKEVITLLESRSDGYVVENESYVDIGNVRFIGMPWYGGSTRPILERIIEELEVLDWDNINYCVMLAHTSIEGQMPNMPEMLSYADLAPLKKYVNYLALGHLHKPYRHPDDDNAWIYNPGAIENNSLDEARFTNKGAFLVEIEDHTGARVKLEVISGRPFQQLSFSITKFGDFASLTDALREEVKYATTKWINDQKPVVNLILTGNLRFDRSQLRIDRLQEIVEQNADCLLVRVTSHLDTLEFIGDYDDDIAVEQLERLVFADLAKESGYGEQAEKWGRYLQYTKNTALNKESPEQIYDSFVNHLQSLDQPMGDS